MPNDEKSKVTGLEGLLNGVPLDPKDQWRMAARVNSIRDIILEFVTSHALETSNPAVEGMEFDDAREYFKQKQKELENNYLEAMNSKRASSIEKKAKDARYRRFR